MNPKLFVNKTWKNSICKPFEKINSHTIYKMWANFDIWKDRVFHVVMHTIIYCQLYQKGLKDKVGVRQKKSSNVRLVTHQDAS